MKICVMTKIVRWVADNSRHLSRQDRSAVSSKMIAIVNRAKLGLVKNEDGGWDFFGFAKPGFSLGTLENAEEEILLFERLEEISKNLSSGDTFTLNGKTYTKK